MWYAKFTAQSGVTSVEEIRQITHPIQDHTDSASDRLYRLQYVTTALSQAVTSQQIAEIVVQLGSATLKAAGSTVWLFDRNHTLFLSAATGYTKEQLGKISQAREEGSTPTLDAIRLKKPIFIRSLEDRKKLYPNTVKAFEPTGKETFIAIPFLIGNTVLGAVNFSFNTIYEIPIEEQEFIYILVQQCAQALDRARLYDEQAKRNEELEDVINKMDTLQKATVLLTKAVTPQEMGNILLELGTKELGAFGGDITILSADKKKIRIIAYKGYPLAAEREMDRKWNEVSTSQPLLSLEVIKTKKPLIISDTSTLPKQYKTAIAFNKIVEMQAAVLLPLITEDKLDGVFALYFPLKTQLAKSDIDFLMALTQLFAQAYARGSIFETEKQQREQLGIVLKRIESLQYITSLLSKAVTLKEVLQTIVNEGIKILGAKGGEVALLIEDKKTLKVVAYKGYPSEYVNKQIKKKDEFSSKEPLLMWDVVKSGRPLYIENVSDVPSRFSIAKKFVNATSFKSQATLPLGENKEIFGCIQLLFDQAVYFTQEDKDFLISLSQQAAQAIGRSRIFENQVLLLQQLSESEENWKQLAETIPQLVWTSDAKGKADYYNTRWEEYTGLSSQQIAITGKLKSYIHPQDLSEIEKLWSEALKEKKAFEGEYRLRRKTGEYRWFLIKALPIKDKNGRVIKWFGTVTDIHQQKLIAEELEKREARFRSLIENSTDAIALLDKNGTIIYSSPSTTRITGFTPEERFRVSVYSSIYPKDKEKVKEFLHELVSSPEGKILTVHYRRINKDGSIPWMEATGRNLLTNPNVGAVVVNYRNITDQVEAEQSIREAKDELEAILENTAEAIEVWSARGTILYMNQAAVEINHYNSKEEFYDEGTIRNFLSRFESFEDENSHSISEEAHPVLQVLSTKKPIHKIIKFVYRENHKEEWRSIKAVPIFDSQGNIALVVVVLHDESESKQQEKIKDEFISTASHELKTPITSAKLYSGMLQEKIQQLGDEKTYSMIIKLDQQLDRLTKLINDLLDVSKMKAGTLSFSKTNISIESLLREVVDEMQYTTVTHKLIFSGHSPKVLYIDKERMHQVLVNLISNAIKYSPDEDRVDILLQDRSDGVNICIKDYGVGIEKKEQGKIFEPFYRSALGKFPGLGLGLHISHEIVKKLDGKLSIESKIGEGTKMCVFLPAKKNNEQKRTIDSNS